MIKNFKVNDVVSNELFYCSSKSTGVSKTGSTFYTITLQDKSGIIEGKIWEVNDPRIEDFEAGDFIKVTGQISSFNNNNQMNIKNLSVVENSDINIEDFCPTSRNNIDEMFENLNAYIDHISNSYLKQLLQNLFGNETFANKFKKNSAAKTVHHAYVGGLLEHTLSVTELCSFIADKYPTINRDLLITAAICHDIGKVKEISAFPENDYTDDGILLGHIYLGAEMVDIQARKIENFPKKLLSELKHCILAHHGALEYGSPKVPALIEATALCFADDTDAKLRRFSDLLDDENSIEWSAKNDFFLNSKYRRTIIEE